MPTYQLCSNLSRNIVIELVVVQKNLDLKYFEPEVIKEIRNTKSSITISFDRWGSKHKKISVLGVVIHFINNKYENVTRLISLSELPGHGKTGIS